MAIGKDSLKRAASSASGRKAREKTEIQQPWLSLVPASQIREIPDEWRGAKYVRTNVSLLAESISRCGILEPLLVVRTGEEEYQMVGGSRRMEAARMLGIQSIPVLVLPGSTHEDALVFYRELYPFSGAAMDTIPNVKFRTAASFGSRELPDYLL